MQHAHVPLARRAAALLALLRPHRHVWVLEKQLIHICNAVWVDHCVCYTIANT
jgi:hypothetical protein